MGGPDLLNLNLSVVYQLLIYGFTVFFLSAIMFRPVMRTLTERNRRISEAGGSSEWEEEVKKKEAEYMARLKVVRSEGAKQRSALRQASLEEEKRTIETAQQQVSDHMKATRDRISKEMQAAKDELSSQIPQLAGEVASRLLGRNVA